MMRDIDSMPSALMGYAAGLGLLAHREAISDGGGRFELQGVEAGELHLRAFHREQAWGLSSKITLVAGGTVEGVRVEMHLGGGVEGTVSDRYGRPVAGDVVLALAPMAMGGMGSDRAMGALYQGFTDAKGAYRISHMAAGSYFLVVTRGDEALNPMSFLGRLNFDMVTIVEGQVVKYDLVDTTSSGCRVTGLVHDSGRPVTEGMLQALGFEGGGALGIDMKMARLSGDGRFEFPGLAPGRWQLTLLETVGPDVRMELDVPDQPEYRVDLSLPDGGLEGSVIDGATGEAVAGADVTVRPTNAPKIKGLLSLAIGGEAGASRAQTNDQGSFQFGRLCEAEYEVSVRPPRSKDSGKKWAPPEPVVVRVREGRVERGCVLRLSPPLTLSGFVRGSSGEPLEGARVLLRRQDRVEGRPERTRSDANGRFEIGGLAPAVYLASASAKDHAATTVRDIRVEGDDAKVEIQLQPGVLVTVRVFGNDGQPLAGARATLFRGDSENPMDAADADRVLEGLFKGEGASDIDGRIEMGRFLPGEYRLEVQRGASTVTRPRVRISADRGETELRADLP
jgi:protocatechuate 3,4-dioxygenase beta subunit